MFVDKMSSKNDPEQQGSTLEDSEAASRLSSVAPNFTVRLCQLSRSQLPTCRLHSAHLTDDPVHYRGARIGPRSYPVVDSGLLSEASARSAGMGRHSRDLVGSGDLFPLRLGVRRSRTGHSRAHCSHKIPSHNSPAPLRAQSHVHRCVWRTSWRGTTVSSGCAARVCSVLLHGGISFRDLL